MTGRFEWDAAKAARNLERHGIPFERTARIDWTVAVELRDTRFDYDEERIRCFAPIDGRVHVLIYTWRLGTRRVISLRKANLRERRYYEEASSPST